MWRWLQTWPVGDLWSEAPSADTVPGLCLPLMWPVGDVDDLSQRPHGARRHRAMRTAHGNRMFVTRSDGTVARSLVVQRSTEPVFTDAALVRRWRAALVHLVLR